MALPNLMTTNALIERIIHIAKNETEDRAKHEIQLLFRDHNMAPSYVQEWTDADFEGIKTGYPDKPTGQAPVRVKAGSKTVTTYTDAPEADVAEALKRMGYGETNEGN